MKKTINARVKEVRLSLKKMPQTKFAKFSGLSISMVQKIESEEVSVSEESIEKLERNCNVDPNWLRSGKGDMWKDGEAPEVNLVEPTDNPWKNEAIQNLKSEVAYYRQLLMQITGGKNFLRLIDKAARETRSYGLTGS